MPHAADGRLQHWNVTIEEITLKFQCRTRQMVGCNNYVIVLPDLEKVVSMPHAADGRLQHQGFGLYA